MKSHPNLSRAVVLTALALALCLTGSGWAQYANDGAFQKADGTWGIPYPQCSDDNSFIPRTECRGHIIAATSSADCTAAYPTYRSGGACSDATISNSTDCGTAGETWLQPACRADAVYIDYAGFVGTGAAERNNCTRCHNSLRADGAAWGVGETYVMTGHKNMVKPLVPGTYSGLYYDPAAPWANKLGAPYSSVNWTNDTSVASGKHVYWIYDWIQPEPRLLEQGQTYGCARCHNTGFSADATINEDKEPFLTFPFYEEAGVFSTAGNGAAYNSWDQWGIQCSRCHGSQLVYDGPGPGTTMDFRHSPNVSPEKAAVDGSYVTKAACEAALGTWNPEPSGHDPYCSVGYTANGATRTNLCMDCHRQEASNVPMSPTDAADLKVGNSHGALGFVSHAGGNQYLNSPHARFDGAFAEIGDEANYDSHFMAETEGGGCTGCHNVHKSSLAEANPAGGAIGECNECHGKNLATMRHPATAGTPLEFMGDAEGDMEACEMCHMPGGLHLFRVSVDEAYSTFPLTALAGTVSANTADDDGYSKAVWVDLDMACGQCHGGGSEQVLTAGDIANTSKDLYVDTTAGFAVGQRVEVKGAGAAGADLETYVTGVDVPGGRVTLYAAAGGTVANAEVTQNPTKNGANYISKARLAPLAKGIHGDAATANFSIVLGNPNTLDVFVNASASICPGGCDRYDWEWGDGQTDSFATTYPGGIPTPPSPSATHHYATGGKKFITLTVTDYSHAPGIKTKPVNVYTPDEPPTIDTETDPCSFDANTWTMTVSEAAAQDDNGIKQQVVNWGDGSLVSNQLPPFVPFVHTFTKVGAFPVKLMVVDTIGQGASYTCLANVQYFTISGKVIKSAGAGGGNVYSAKIQAWKGATLVKTVYSLADGTFSVGNLKPGDYDLVVTKTGYTFPVVPTVTVGPTQAIGNIQAVTP